VLAYLHGKGYKLGVIANQSPGTEERLHSWGLLKYFSTVAASAELGISKPDKKIFLKALEISHCSPENAAMIGDRLDNDICPAMALGMKTVWIKQGISAYQQLDNNGSAPDHIIKSLIELTEIF
jgi:FMN phosphatase YigB (HAD superfamily)